MHVRVQTILVMLIFNTGIIKTLLKSSTTNHYKSMGVFLCVFNGDYNVPDYSLGIPLRMVLRGLIVIVKWIFNRLFIDRLKTVMSLIINQMNN